MRTRIVAAVVVGAFLALVACDDEPPACDTGRYWHVVDQQCYPQGPTCGEGYGRDPHGSGGCIPVPSSG